MTAEELLADLARDIAPAERLQRIVDALRRHFRCGAVALLRSERDHMRPVAAAGLTVDALGRRFALAQHPRLAAILARHGVTAFDHDSTLPDPYDGLIDGHAGEPLPVHDCMGTALAVDGSVWGVLTLDALAFGTFDDDAKRDLGRLAPLVEATIRVAQIETEKVALRQSRTEVALEGLSGEGGEILGQSPALLAILREIDVVADTELPVLLLGETGVGKELFALRIHRLSRRRTRPLVHVNCAALPESLAESELFGHARGAFSGAISDRPGRIEAANGGTLFLDEVGELPLSTQAKLLRTLQNGEIQRLGADRPLQVDVRVVAATNRRLPELVQEGSFRADLYHRLTVYPVPIPPLRDRGNDALLLAGRFLELNRARLGLRGLRLAPDAEIALLRYPWPGNVRELEHVISRAALKTLSRGVERGSIVTLDASSLDLQAGVPVAAGAAPPAASRSVGAAVEAAPLRLAVESLQREIIRQALAAHGGRWAPAARQLELDPSNLRKLARRLGIKGED